MLEIQISGMNFDATEEDLRAFFEGCGEITKLKLLKYKEGTLAGKNNSGKAFVHFKEENGAKEAAKKSGSTWMEREVTVEVVKPQATKQQLSVFVSGLAWAVIFLLQLNVSNTYFLQ